MLRRVIISLIISGVTANAAVTIGIQGGSTHFTRGSYIEENAIGYRGDIFLSSRGDKWGGEVNIRALAFPGGINSADFALDFAFTRYFFGGATHPYLGPVLGFSAKRVNFDEGPKGPGTFSNNTARLGFVAGVRHYFRAKYLDVSAALVYDIVFGNLNEKMFDSVYNEKTVPLFADIAVEAEFFWAFTDHFGVTFKGGIMAESYMLNTEMYKGTDVLFFYQAGPSFYL